MGDRQSMESLHKIGGLGTSANYDHLGARVGLVVSLKSKRMSN